MTEFELFLIAFGCLVLIGVAWILATVFRSGLRSQFVIARPFVTYALFAFSIPFAQWIKDWVRGDRQLAHFVLVMATGALFFAIASTVWFAGFLVGRGRRERRSGIISGRR